MGFGATAPDSVKFLSIILTIAVRNPHVIGKAVPGTAPNYMIFALGGALGILTRTLLIVSGIIPIENPFGNISRHLVHAFGGFTKLQRTYFPKSITFIDKTTPVEVGAGFIGNCLSPGISPMLSAACRSLPFRLGGESLAPP